MTFDELQRTLTEAVATGRIGQPVALRLYAWLPDGHDLEHWSLELRNWAEKIAGAPPVRVAVSPEGSRRQKTILATCQNGRTLMVTVAIGSYQPQLHLLLVGNQGVIRLEGGELFEPTPV